MELEIPPSLPEESRTGSVPEAPPAAASEPVFAPGLAEPGGLPWVFSGSQGLRAGWSVLLFVLLFSIFSTAAGFVFFHLHLIGKKEDFTATGAFFGELVAFLAMAGAAALVARIEGRGIFDFYLTGPRRFLHFLSGLAAGFATLSALIGTLYWGGWLHFGPIALSGAAIFQFGGLWAAAFLLVGFFEEGCFRCYLQFTLTRGINFWWALAVVGALCLDLLVGSKGSGLRGVYAAALLGLAPCLILHIRKTPRSGFWQASWVTSTAFGFIHITNNGENWIGIFAAAFIGFVFCVSIWVTGSAWWAIGCHAAWDWAETYFYGAIDSGMQPTGHYLTTSPSGNALWSGGADGPEGSLLVLGITLLLLVALVVIYGRKRSAALATPAARQAAE